MVGIAGSIPPDMAQRQADMQQRLRARRDMADPNAVKGAPPQMDSSRMAGLRQKMQMAPEDLGRGPGGPMRDAFAGGRPMPSDGSGGASMIGKRMPMGMGASMGGMKGPPPAMGGMPMYRPPQMSGGAFGMGRPPRAAGPFGQMTKGPVSVGRAQPFAGGAIFGGGGTRGRDR